MQDKYLEREINQRKQLIEEAGQYDKYDRQGIYGIFVQGKLVYVGKSANMLWRVASHILAIDGIGKDSTGRKYQILRTAKSRGLQISFDVLEYIDGTSSDLDRAEAKWINQELPILNTQIPHPKFYKQYTLNQEAKNMTFVKFQQFLDKS